MSLMTLYSESQSPHVIHIEISPLINILVYILKGNFMKFIIYRIINTINKKYYIGMHQTKNIDDKYMGSGKLLKLAFSKYGKENFFGEILFIFDNKKDMISKEKELITENFCTDSMTYNLAPGGQGGSLRKGFSHSDKTKKLFSMQRIGNKSGQGNRGRILSQEHKNKISKSSQGRIFSEEHSRKLSEANRRRVVTKTKCEHCDMIISGGNYKLWRGNNCKNYSLKPENVSSVRSMLTSPVVYDEISTS